MPIKPSAKDKLKKGVPKRPVFDFSESKLLKDWVNLITDENQTPLGHDVKYIAKLNIADPNLDIDEALREFESPPASNRILRIVNNVYLTPAETFLTAIPRATVILGFQSMRNIALCVAIYSHLIKNAPENNKLFLQEIALTMQASVLAALIAQRRSKATNYEALATAALMVPLGKLLFLFFGGASTQKYYELLEKSPVISAQQETEILGFTFKELGLKLTSLWNMGVLVQQVHENPMPGSITFTLKVARDVVFSLKNGWKTDEAKTQLKKFETFLGDTEQKTHALVFESAEKTLEELSLYKCNKLMDFIHLPAVAEEMEEVGEEAEPPIPVASRFKAALQELSTLVASKKPISTNDVITVGLKGIFSGLDFDRVLVALVSQDRNILKAKAILEKEQTAFFEHFNFELMSPEGWLFGHILRERRTTWLGSKTEVVLKKFRTSEFNKKVGKGQFFAAPLVLEGKGIGVYFADRQPSCRRLDTRTYDAFTELCAAINESIEIVRKKK